MGATGAFPEGPASVGVAPAEPGGLLDVLGVAAVVLDSAGRIALWSPQAEELFGWTADQALGRFAAPCWWPRSTSTWCCTCSRR